jgi:hypothetical protein
MLARRSVGVSVEVSIQRDKRLGKTASGIIMLWMKVDIYLYVDTLFLRS